ncbi:hypothetical protein DN069_08575 [Streptacidiphilus pinicola]|uniref:DUF4097 domain-containing protein n=1 Tax=Streptacidiphilus pinicola TaxID=2219663 RepID=A0A2X0IN14_9ACTN|nr:DUF4097 family beta strand repeat-containing protein [Streptacidiphilus pinicola]RAG86057.1 hypothetical protein DN069_08575 [Streptacidiphilus pinicola]
MSESKFATPSPISVVLDLYVADVRFSVSDRTDTVVEIKPSDPGKPADAKAVENTRVEYDETTRTLNIVSRKPLKRFVEWSSKRPESIDVVIALPTDSEVRGEADLGDFHADGALGTVQLKTGLGCVRLTETGPLNVRGGVGQISVTSVSGPTQVHSGSGDIQLGTLDGTADVSNDNGKVHIGAITGPATVKCSNGAVTVDRALSDITAASSNGVVRIGEVVRGKVSATSKNGSVEVGVREGTAAWLELSTGVGRVYNELGAAAAPEADEPVDRVELRAGTKLGDVTIRRAVRLED